MCYFQRYVSKFRPTVIEETKPTNYMKTMGPTRLDVPIPNNYLKKHSKEPRLPESEFSVIIELFTFWVYFHYPPILGWEPFSQHFNPFFSPTFIEPWHIFYVKKSLGYPPNKNTLENGYKKFNSSACHNTTLADVICNKFRPIKWNRTILCHTGWESLL